MTLGLLALQIFDEGSEDRVLDIVVTSEVDFDGEDIVEHGGHLVARRSGVVLDQEVLKLGDLELDLVVTLDEDADVVVAVALACHELAGIGEDDSVLVVHVLTHLFGVLIEEAAYDIH